MSQVKVTQVKAFKSENGCLWETEKEAIEQNIEEAMPQINSDTYLGRMQELKEWFKNNKHSVRYILANIDKIDV